MSCQNYLYLSAVRHWEIQSLYSDIWVGLEHNVKWIPLGPKLSLIIKQQVITGAPLAWHWGVRSCVWHGPNIWFGSWQAHCYKANIVMTDVWWRTSGAWKIHLSSQLKLRGGREERDMGPEGLGGYPLCGPHLRTCVCLCFCRGKWGKEEWTSACRTVGFRPEEAWELVGSSFSPKCSLPPTLLPCLISFPCCVPHPAACCRVVRNLSPLARDHFNVGSLAKAIRDPDLTHTHTPHTRLHAPAHTHKLALKHSGTLRVVSYQTWRHGMRVLSFPSRSNTASPSGTTS